jgi:hypothetical protein
VIGGIEREAARYRIGPLTTYADPSDLEVWMRRAAPGDETWYAIGPALGEKAAAPKLARRLAGDGLATLFLRRVGGGLHYMIRKRAPAASAISACGRIAAPAATERALYEVLCQVADDGLPLPSNEVLAERAGLPDRHAARYRLSLLVAAGFVQVEVGSGRRVVQIVATGQRTAGGKA